MKLVSRRQVTLLNGTQFKLSILLALTFFYGRSKVSFGAGNRYYVIALLFNSRAAPS